MFVLELVNPFIFLLVFNLLVSKNERKKNKLINRCFLLFRSFEKVLFNSVWLILPAKQKNWKLRMIYLQPGRMPAETNRAIYQILEPSTQV